MAYIDNQTELSSGLYRIINKVNGKFYIGSSSDINRRFISHKNYLNKNKHDNIHLQNAWNKYGKENFLFEIYKKCDINTLIEEEQKELNIWVGNSICYNVRKDAKCPVAPGEKRPEWVCKKISESQIGKVRWTEEQRKKMSIDRIGRTHSKETKQKMCGREVTIETRMKISNSSVGKLCLLDTCSKISNTKKNARKVFSNEELQRISEGVRLSYESGKCKKNKIPLTEYDNIKLQYLSGNINKRQLAIKYGITPSSMAKLLKRIGI